MRGVRSGDLASEVSERDELLRSSGQVAEADLAGRQLVADDDREVGMVAVGRLELLAELAAREIGPGRDPGCPEVRRDPQPGDGVGRVGTDDDRDRSWFRRCCDTGLGQCQKEPVEADPEADPGRRPAAEHLDEAVVAAAAAERLLLALAPDDVVLERRPGVVVEAADEAGFQPVRHAERVEVGADRGEVLGACDRTAGR